ncbi:hypothetical protein RB595_005108 [Gaeumannomyces hyphopodioides]
MAASSTQYVTPMGRGAYDTTGVPKPPPPKPSCIAHLLVHHQAQACSIFGSLSLSDRLDMPGFPDIGSTLHTF